MTFLEELEAKGLPTTVKIQVAVVRELTTGIRHTDGGNPEILGMWPYGNAIMRITGPQHGGISHSFRGIYHDRFRSLPAAYEAIQPYIRKYVTDPYFWDEKYDPNCTGSIELPVMTDEEYEEFKEIHQREQYALANTDAWAAVGTVFPYARHLHNYPFESPEPAPLCKPHNIQITDKQWQLARKIGDGNASAGIRYLLSIYELGAQ